MPSSPKKRFSDLASSGQPTGEVTVSERAIAKIAGLDTAPIGARVLFEDGQVGFVKAVEEEEVIVFNLTSEKVPIGTLAVLESETFEIPAGPELLGRIVDFFGRPLDNQGTVGTKTMVPVFATAPGISERGGLNQQLASGVMMADSLFPILLGQRIAVLGDHQTGKTTFMSQLIRNQAGTGRAVIYVMIGKRRADLDTLVTKLRESGAMDYTTLVVAGVFDSLGATYLAPYAGCAMAENFWKSGTDAVVIYDDLTSHAKAYRELSLLSGLSPGRDSYPGDIFYIHSQLIERAGKLQSGSTLTALPLVVSENDDITGYLPTNIMSMCDGQLVFDQETFKLGIRPAINAGISVSRVGGRGQNERSQYLTQQLLKRLVEWRTAKEFAQFGSDLGLKTRNDLELGDKIYDAFKQAPQELYSLEEQQLILEAILESTGRKIDVSTLKGEAKRLAAIGSKDHDSLKRELLTKSSVQR